MTERSKMNVLSPPPAGQPLSAFTIGGFCTSHGIGKSLFYELKRNGKAPRTIKVGRKRIITVEAAADWRRKMEEETAEAEAAGA